MLLSQTVDAQKDSRLYEKGMESFAAHRYETALKYFEEVAQINPDFGDIQYRLETATLLTGKGDKKSLDKLLAYESSFGKSDNHYYYWLGQIYTRRYQIDKAIAAYETFQSKATYDGTNDETESAELIAYSVKLKEFFENPDDFEIHQLEPPVNSKSAELSPVYFEEKNELLFASNRNNGDDTFVIYHTQSTENGWSSPKAISSLGAFTRSNANIEVVNEDGRLFLFREDNGGDLFYSEPVNSGWPEPVEFDARVSNNHLASHFFINEHEDRIIFASDEGREGLDIFESFKDPENGKWSRPKPFHSSINSDFNEDSPYLSPDETTLYFCSDRPGGVGGYDVYVSTFDSEDFSWSEPENMGWPINSPNDEFHFKMNSDQNSGYMVSDRLNTLGDYDIYFFWRAQKVTVQGRIFDNAVKGPLVNAEIRFHPSQYMDEYFTSKIDASGRYSTSIFSDEIFLVEILKDGNIIHEEKFEIHDHDGDLSATHIKDFSVN